MSLNLVIGNKNYSSWSLRPWLLMKHAGLDFKETRIQLYQADSAKELLRHNPAGKVPALRDGDLLIWDSLAICEYIAEKTGFGWPKEVAARAHARAISAEMHSGFVNLRSQAPMNARAKRRIPSTPDLERDVARIDAIWQDCRQRYGAAGPFLFGNFTIADAMYAPVVLRFNTYGMKLSPASAAYVQTLLADRHLADWLRVSREETWIVAETESVGTPV